MPGQAPPVADERQALLTYLAQMRYVLRLTAHGLTDDQARATPSVSSLSVGGLIKHVTSTEQNWINIVLQRTSAGSDDVDYEANFKLLPGETLEAVLAVYEKVAANTEAVIGSIAD